MAVTPGYHGATKFPSARQECTNVLRDSRRIPRGNYACKGCLIQALQLEGTYRFVRERWSLLSGLRRMMVSLRLEPVEIISILHSEISSRYWR